MYVKPPHNKRRLSEKLVRHPFGKSGKTVATPIFRSYGRQIE